MNLTALLVFSQMQMSSSFNIWHVVLKNPIYIFGYNRVGIIFLFFLDTSIGIVYGKWRKVQFPLRDDLGFGDGPSLCLLRTLVIALGPTEKKKPNKFCE